MKETIVDSLHSKGLASIENMLSPIELKEINDFFDEHKSEFGPALIGKGDNRKRMTEIRGDHTFWIEPLSPPGPFRPVINFLENLKQDLNQKLFLGLKEFECHLAYYPEGSFYIKHLDRFEKDSSRSLSFVFYLNDCWEKNDGGELVIYGEDDSVITTIVPMPGTMVCFLSGEFPHEVRPARKERRSLTGWMHTKIIN